MSRMETSLCVRLCAAFHQPPSPEDLHPQTCTHLCNENVGAFHFAIIHSDIFTLLDYLWISIHLNESGLRIFPCYEATSPRMLMNDIFVDNISSDGAFGMGNQQH